ncbi:MAG: type 2 isopentenyl-diphosphate Delta-isomerase [Candidatus Dormibacteria bacterium]
MASGPSPLPDDPPGIVDRKAEHIRINLEEDVAAKGVTTGFERYRFVHRALPEIDLESVSLETSFLGRRLDAPLLFSCMTGGTLRARHLNRILAAAAQRHRVAMGLGSCRVLLEHPEVLATFAVRHLCPDVPLLANLGAVQLNLGVGTAACRRIVDLLEADALVLHLNPLQEALQPEGNTRFAGLFGRIEALCASLGVPVIVKEVGWGIAPDLVTALFEAGVAAVDVAGAGGTSWSEVERHRIADPARARVAAAFADWGLPTADAIRLAREAAPRGTLIASGGIRSGVDVAMAIALGADLAGCASSLLRAADEGEEALDAAVGEITDTLRIAMFCAGARDVGSLVRDAQLIERRGGEADRATVLTGARRARHTAPREADVAGGTP